jgi:hypothetical protein
VAVDQSDNPETAAEIKSATTTRGVGRLSEVVAISDSPGKMESTSAMGRSLRNLSSDHVARHRSRHCALHVPRLHLPRLHLPALRVALLR